MEIVSRSIFIAGSVCNHARVIKQLGVFGAESQRLLYGRFCFEKASGFERCPGQSISTVDVATYGIFLGGHRIGLLYVEVMVGEEERLLPVVEHSRDVVEMGYNANQLISGVCIFFTSHQSIEISKRGHKRRIGKKIDRPLIQIDGPRKVTLRGAYTGKRSDRPEIVRKGRQRISVIPFRTSIVPYRKGNLAQLPAAPSNCFTRWRGHS